MGLGHIGIAIVAAGPWLGLEGLNVPEMATCYSLKMAYGTKSICNRSTQCCIYSGNNAEIIELGPSKKYFGLAENCA